jgi:hypothetical protein
MLNKEPVPFEAWRWKIVEDTGWTLEYVDSLTLSDMREYMQVLDGTQKAQTSILR